ncbi:MAG: hypothetical protein WC658_01705 [Candidatus Omnitrophota bacterium]
MKKYLSKLPGDIQDLIHLVSAIAEKNNMPAYLVGGFVRDLVLGVRNLDLDIAVEGEGIKFAQALAHKLEARLVSHKRFGTATIHIKNGPKIDIATARLEVYPEPAHLPIISPGSLQDDHFRRDFTINAMAISINQKDFGRLFDLYGGEGDLRKKKIRVLHGLSFIDDPTRILRAVRFATRYNFRLELATLRLLKEAVKSGMLERVEPQRTRDEIILLLKEKRPLRALKKIQRLTGFKFLSPHLALDLPVMQLLRRLDLEIVRFSKSYPKRRPLDIWLTFFMGLVDCLSIGEVKSLCAKLSLRKGEVKRILSYKKIGRRFISELSSVTIKPSRIFAYLEPLSYEVIILLKAKYTGGFFQRHIADFFKVYNGMRTWICGDDLCALGLKPGPAYKRIISRVLQARLNGKINTKEQELLFIRRLIKKP